VNDLTDTKMTYVNNSKIKKDNIMKHWNKKVQGYSGPYYPLGFIGTVPRAYDMFRVYEGMCLAKGAVRV
jgi:hypothetical protein